MNDRYCKILGKTITGVLRRDRLSSSPDGLGSRFILFFDDGTSFEIDVHGETVLRADRDLKPLTIDKARAAIHPGEGEVSADVALGAG